jgi:hypothetical protein
MTEVTIGGKKHPLYFNMVAIERVMQGADVQNFDQLAQTGQGMANTLAFARLCAFYGVQAGYKKIGEKCPYKDAEELAEEVTSLAEITPALNAFTEAVSTFFAVAPEEAQTETEGN